MSIEMTCIRAALTRGAPLLPCPQAGGIHAGKEHFPSLEPLCNNSLKQRLGCRQFVVNAHLVLAVRVS